jgi:photosystem II stability/assembly factor-like uncharacterized protein
MKIIITILLFSFLSIHTANTQPTQGWFPQNSGTTVDLKNFSRYFFEPDCIVGNNGIILRTTNSGQNWSIIPSGTNNNLNAALFYSTTTGVTAGSGGTILKTTDQGINWFALNSGTNGNLYAIAWFGSSRLVAVGDNGIIIRSTNSGTNWTPVSSPTSNHLRSVTYTGSALGWAAGFSGTILTTTDYGASWYTLSSPSSNNLNASIYKGGTLWIAGDNGTILKSTNNGSNWLTLNSNTLINLTSVCAIDTMVAWVCGANGVVLRTYNGGTNWTPRSTGTTRNLNYVFFIDINTGWAIGELGTILHTNTDSYAGAAKKLDANNISTWFRNNGSFNYNNNGIPGFEWPKGTNKFARFASGMWLGARVGNDTLVAVALYNSEYLPGYTDNNGLPQGQYDPNYVVYKLSYGVSDQDRQFWPNILLGNSNQGAPVYFDNQTNSWKPLDFGNQTLFYRYTDSYPGSHTVSGGRTAPLKADIMKLDFAIDVPGGLGDAAFSQFTIINRSTQIWYNTYISFWTDDDLGESTDDKVGCDSAIKLEYTYNATNNDPVYGNAPPAVGFVGLRGAIIYTGNPNDTAVFCRNKTIVRLAGYKDIGLTVMRRVAGGDPLWGVPLIYRETYRMMQGKLLDGSNIVHPNGYVTTFSHTGDPVTGQGWLLPNSGDQMFLISTGPVNMNPGDTEVIVIAQVIARGTSNLNSITRLRELTEVVKNYYNTCYTSPPIGIEPQSNELPTRFQLFQNYPNPFNSISKIKYQIAKKSDVKIVIYDVLGQELEILVEKNLSPGTYEIEWNANNYPSSVYYYRLVAGDFAETKKMVLIK